MEELLTQALLDQLTAQPHTRRLGELLAHHCELRWTPERLEITLNHFADRRFVTHEFLHADATLRTVWAAVRELTGTDIAVCVQDPIRPTGRMQPGKKRPGLGA
jgi:hypothetical protein